MKLGELGRAQGAQRALPGQKPGIVCPGHGQFVVRDREGAVVTSMRRELARRRRSQGFSQQALAERLGVDEKTVRRWESGTGGAPQPWIRPKLAALLEISAERLDELFRGDGEGTDRGERVAHSLRHPRTADASVVASLRDEVRTLDELYDRSPSTSLLARTGQCLGQVAFLSGNVGSERTRRDLLSVEAETAILMGQLVWDASQRSDHGTARRYFDDAIAAARAANDSSAEGRALLRKSFVALYGEKDPVEGLRLTMRTAEAAGESRVLQGLAVLHTAEAHAMMGDRADCERALSDADTSFGQIRESDAALDLFSPSQSGRLAGSCYLFLDKPAMAAPILESTAQELRQRSKSRSIVLGNLGLAYIRQGQLDDAVGALHDAIDVIESTRGGGGLNIVFGACRELQPWRNADVVQDVYDRAMSLMTA